MLVRFATSNIVRIAKLQINNIRRFFDVLLTMHLSIFISVINQLDAQNFCFTGVMIPEAVYCNFYLLLMSTCARNT